VRSFQEHNQDDCNTTGPYQRWLSGVEATS